ncbi:vascular endothelial growth factor receptor 3 [Erpetoichthys calabaricus]|uniref:Vascular endothelial growth factor receptor 3 n=1 Tax=Erpetoichthys calabaricus TaxID=27687 RepID=A0A8C4SBC3_ERPCA|nr:vascular endothelial growth factor receptor 3 [Erpetoichthys calabaricus]
MKRDFTFFFRTWIWIVWLSALVIGYSMSPPTLDSPGEELVINANDTLTITCRGERILDWTWPEDSGYNKKKTKDHQEQQPSPNQPNQWSVEINECQGIPGKPYCKIFTLTRAQSSDTGYYRCYYQGPATITDGTTAASIYVFVRDEQKPFIMKYDSISEVILLTKSLVVEIPCMVSIPDLDVSLFKFESAQFSQIDDKMLTWDNRKGFSVMKDQLNFLPVMCQTVINNITYHSSFFFPHLLGTEVFKFNVFPSEVELVVGEQLFLNCTAVVEFNTGMEFSWTYPGQQTNRTVSIRSERNLLEKWTEVFSTFLISSVNVTDSGVYTCTGNNGDTPINSFANVTVHEKPFIEIHATSGLAIEATAGQNFEMPVEMDAYPLPEVQWYKDGKLIIKSPEFNRIKQDHYKLEIREVSQENAGNYTLVLKNYASNLEAKVSLFLTVNVPPHIHEKEMASPTIIYPRGSRQTLTCTADGVPTPTSVSWHWRPWGPCGDSNTNAIRQHGVSSRHKRAQSVHCENWQEVDILDHANKIDSIDSWIEDLKGENKTVSRLVIQNANVSVVYKCSAANKVDKDERDIYFYVTTIPEGFGIDLYPSEEPIEQQLVSLKCSADNYTYENLQWYRLGSQVLQDDHGNPLIPECKSVHKYADRQQGNLTFNEATNSWILEVNISHIQLNDEGDYVCEVQNRRTGERHCHRKYITVQAQEAPRLRQNLVNQTVNVSESMLMKCDVVGTPAPQISWFKDEKPLYEMSGIVLQDSNQTLSIQRVREEDAGLYTCSACNEKGCISMSAKVSVEGSDDKTSVEIVIMVGTGIIAIIFWILLILIFCNVKKANPADIKTGYLSIIMDPVEVPLEEQCEYLPYDSSQWEFPRDRLRLGKVLGHGAFGKVVEASAFGIDKSNSLNTVAVKMLKEGATASEYKALMSELKILIHIGNHLNVVNLLGACTKPNGPLMVIVEYCKYGNLSNYLRTKRETFLPYRDHSPKMRSQVRSMMEAVIADRQNHVGANESTVLSRIIANHNQNYRPSLQKVEDLWKTPLTMEDLICYSFQVARGMEFLASRKCIHRDLAARNILLSENNVVKICDFGLARDIYKDPDYVRKGNARLPLKWMAPESIFDKVYTTQSDVWSFGVLLWEIFSLGASPYPGVQIDEEFCQRLKEGTRMRAPENASPEIYQIMLACWQGEPRKRPTFPTLVEILGDLLQENVLKEGKDYIPLNLSQSSEDDGFSQASSRPPSQEEECELHLACEAMAGRYYNCLSFSGCLNATFPVHGHGRVKTFEEYPLEQTSHKTHLDNQTDSGMVLASEEFERIEHKHRGVMAHSSSRRTDATALFTEQIGLCQPPYLCQLSGQTFYNNEYGQLCEDGLGDFFTVPGAGDSDTACLSASSF